LVTGAAGSASAQVLPEHPISLAGGHFVFGAEVTATIAPEDPGFFNYTSYEFSALRNLRMGVSAEIRANDHIQVLGEVRFDQGRLLEAYGLYVRVRPWPARRFDIQAGRVPPTFGAMSRSAYGSSNILIGQPLAYQYLTSVHADALPATVEDLLRMRGRGWLSNFPVGNTAPPGCRSWRTSRWDTRAAHGVTGDQWTGSVTAGSRPIRVSRQRRPPAGWPRRRAADGVDDRRRFGIAWRVAQRDARNRAGRRARRSRAAGCAWRRRGVFGRPVPRARRGDPIDVADVAVRDAAIG
jgi:hypothetical protein